MSPRVVVGFDGSEDARECVRWAADHARLIGATLDLVHAYDYPYLERLDEATRSELEAHAQAVLDEGLTVATETAEPLVVSPLARVGNPAAMLIEASEGADLLVVGRRGIGRARRWILGSVATKCLHGASCPVVAVGQPA